MNVFESKKKLKILLAEIRAKGLSLGLVPTMGALHQGHVALIQRALAENSVVVVTIFINPTQFNNKEDLKKYPRTPVADTALLASLSEEIIVFAPEVEEIYTGEVASGPYDFHGMEELMEGKFRKGHFEGVATVVERLLAIIAPDRAYFGEKDYQQLRIIQALVDDLRLPIRIIGCPIVREANGLAMSSRNARLSEEVRLEAGFLYSTLLNVREKFKRESPAAIREWVCLEFRIHPLLSLEYFEIADSETLLPVFRKNRNRQYRAFLAIYAEGVRLIDNMAL